jgi:hypothetical protein
MTTPGRQHAPALAPGHRSGSTPRSRSTFGAVFVRALAVLAVAAGVAVAVGVTSWSAGRASVDRAELLAEGRAQGRLQVLEALKERREPRRTVAPSDRDSAGTVAERSYRRGWRAGRREGASKTSFEQRAHGRMLGAQAALGRLGGWSQGGWYIVQVGAGSTLTGGQPAVTRRVGPLGADARYGLCGDRICRTGAKVAAE